MRLLGRRLRKRDAYRERRTRARRRSKRDLMVEQLRHFPDNGEPKAQTLAVVAFRVADLAELFENRVVHFRTNTPARVPYLQPDPPLFLMAPHSDLTA